MLKCESRRQFKNRTPPIQYVLCVAPLMMCATWLECMYTHEASEHELATHLNAFLSGAQFTKLENQRSR